MEYRIREIEAEIKFCQELDLGAISQVLSKELVLAALEAERAVTQRVRKLDLAVTVLVVVLMNIYTNLSLGHVMQKLARGLRFIWWDPECELPQDSALCYRRYQLGARVLVEVFRRLCRPIATTHTPGAFLFGLRLMAIDGSTEDLPDTPENVAVFGRHSGRTPAAFPQTQCVYLAECGTHAIVDAGFWPIHTSERVGGRRMLRSVTAGMLVMWDRGFHAYALLKTARLDRKAHVLSRLPAHVKPKHLHTLSDGSDLTYLYPADKKRRKKGERLKVRIITYKLTDPALGDCQQRHRLVTTLLDPQLYPALDLVCAYHERWEIEILIDEIDTHQRLAGRTLRSLKPVGVIQELYGLLIAHYVIRSLMHQAALQANLAPDRLSFVHALEVIKEAIPEFQMVATVQHPQLFQRLLRDIVRKQLPERRARINPRVVKRKMSNFRKKRPEHADWPQPSVPFHEAISLI